MPDNVSLVDAAMLPVANGAAHRMLVTHKTVAKGDKVLRLEQAVEGLRLIQQPRTKSGHHSAGASPAVHL